MKILNYSITTRIRTLKLLWLFNILFFSVSFSQDASMLFVGDVMQHDAQITSAYNKKTNSYEYDAGFQFIKPIIGKYDLKIANLEVTLAGKPYKGYPQFSAPDELATSLVDAGFNVILTSNNHSCDRGAKGVVRTLDKLDELGVMHTGTFRSQAERDSTYPLIINQNGIKIAMLNYTYGTNGLTVAKPLIVNYIDSAVIRQDVAKAKKLGADYIVCNMHWGREYKPVPDSYQKKWEKFCYSLDIDMVIGNHPHTVQPIEQKVVNDKERFTVWSLGNFVSNMKIRYTRGGVMVGTEIEKKNDKMSLKQAWTYPIYVLKKQEGATKPYYLVPEFDYNAYRVGFVSATEQKKMDEFFSDTKKLYAEHNKGNIQNTVLLRNSEIGQKYEQLLRFYYSIRVNSNQEKLKKNPILKHYFHRKVSNDGTAHLLCGQYATSGGAKGQYNFLKDCGIDVEMVYVEPTALKSMME